MLFFPVIWGLSALAAPAVSMPDKAETVGDLLNVLRDADKMSVQEARMVLEQMPIPENASIPFSKFIRVVRSIVLAVKSTTPIPEHERLRIYQEIEQLDASFCFLFYNFEFCEARENENGAEMEKIVDKINRFLKRHPELGVTSLLPFPNGGMDTLPEEMQQNIINVLRKNENRADVVLIKDREIICERFAKDAQALATLCEQHACDFKNADVVLRYADAEVANILLPVAPRSLTALRITTEARAKLRSNGIAAGGYVIDFEKDAE